MLSGVKGYFMTRQSADRSAGYMQTLSFMSLVQSEARDLPDFCKLKGEAAVEHVRGEAWARHSLCVAQWTLQGTNGTIEVHASHANDFGCNLVTKVTCKSPELGPRGVSVQFGGSEKDPSSVSGIMEVLSKWLPIITKASPDPFNHVVMPKA